MAREFLVECLVDARRRRGILVARHPARVGVGHPQRGIVELVGPLETRAGILFLACEFEDHAGVQILEDRIPFRPGQLVDVGDRGLGVAGAIAGPARQQRRDQIGDRSAHRLIDVDLRRGVFLLLQVARADHEPRHAVALVNGQDTVGELHGLVDIAFRKRGDEGAIEQFVVFRIGAKCGAVERRRRTRIAFHAGVTRGKIAARHRQRLQIAPGRKLRRVVGRMIGRLRRKRAGHRQRGEGECGNRPAIETNGKHHGSPSSRNLRQENLRRILRSISNANPTGGIKPSDNAAFGVQPQGYGRRIDWMANRLTGGPGGRRFCQLCLKTLSVWRYRGRCGRPGRSPAGSRNRGHIAS